MRRHRSATVIATAALLAHGALAAPTAAAASAAPASASSTNESPQVRITATGQVLLPVTAPPNPYYSTFVSVYNQTGAHIEDHVLVVDATELEGVAVLSSGPCLDGDDTPRVFECAYPLEYPAAPQDNYREWEFLPAPGAEAGDQGTVTFSTVVDGEVVATASTLVHVGPLNGEHPLGSAPAPSSAAPDAPTPGGSDGTTPATANDPALQLAATGRTTPNTPLLAAGTTAMALGTAALLLASRATRQARPSS
ncbi:hypothetical protein [Allostreptomyces psammosilenae]|uniref:Uncharacterized protein n=1 Tax=Allostreptomyces psammosilenae TaxID=1892865 RepID=A0A852ZPH4_9ACTN|nr:hypothetical protein [Allostreptomyces psammosilenae]NYI03377.1 hypothetical protein [Allostreptomyces psammosilenae]